MSKDFQKEYANLLSEDLPDLWSRIEENLSEKTPTPANNKKSRWAVKKNLMGLGVAACLCILLIGSGVHLFMDPARFGKSEEVATSDQAAAYDEMDMMAEDEMFAETEEAEESVIETESTDGAVMEDAGIETEMETEMESEETYESEPMSETESAQSTTSEKERADADTMKEPEAESDMMTDSEEVNAANNDIDTNSTSGSSQELQKESIVCQATVKVMSVENTGEEVIYYGEVIISDAQLVTENNLVAFCISDDEFMPFEIGMTYSLSLENRNPSSSQVPVYIVDDILTP